MIVKSEPTLLGLRVEVRLHILTFVFGQVDVEEVIHYGFEQPISRALRPRDRQILAIARTCKTLRKETLEVFSNAKYIYSSTAIKLPEVVLALGSKEMQSG